MQVAEFGFIDVAPVPDSIKAELRLVLDVAFRMSKQSSNKLSSISKI
jgi:hypothetical protein